MPTDLKEWFISLGGSTIRVTGDSNVLFQEPGVLAEFLTDEREWDRELHCGLVDMLAEPEGTLVFSDPGRRVYAADDGYVSYIGSVASSLDGAYLRVERRGKHHLAQFLRKSVVDRISARAVLNALEVEHLIAENNGILLHASCICYEGKAIAFTAPSGSGKSTQAELWRQYQNAEIINGDRIMIQLTEETCEAIGVPFSGSSGICRNAKMPLQAIVYLSKDMDNKVSRLTGGKAFCRIWEGCSMHTWNREDINKTAEIVERLIQKVPVLYLECTPDQRAVEVLEAELRKIEVAYE